MFSLCLFLRYHYPKPIILYPLSTKRDDEYLSIQFVEMLERELSNITNQTKDSSLLNSRYIDNSISIEIYRNSKKNV